MKIHNFFAGPAILAPEVLEKAENAVKDFEGMGLSLLEISHRSEQFVSVLDNAEKLTRELLNISDEYGIVFLTGGASSQFFMAPMNLLNVNEKAGYLNTGTWSKKAIAEAKHYSEISEVASSVDKNFNYIPRDYTITPNLRYLHLTSNNTIFGTELHKYPNTDVPFVTDMSSNIFSKTVDIEKHDLIYAGAQKNLGPAGTTLVIVKKDALGKVNRKIPTMLDYKTHISKQSSFNTPPVFPIYVCMLTLEWLKNKGGVDFIERENIKKAKHLYEEIDRNGLFEGTAKKEDRSRMNVCFKVVRDEDEARFMALAEKRNLVGLKGHRSVGGFRASIYNALDFESVDALVKTMYDFEREQG